MPYSDFPHTVQLRIADYPGSGYQIKLVNAAGASVINWLPGMAGDFRDIRFSDGINNIPYWIESKTDFTSAVVWIKTTSSAIVTLHYGNGAAVSESNGDNVFESFDDFTGAVGSTPDSNKWTVTKKNAVAVCELDGEGNLKISGDPTGATSYCAAVISTSTISDTSVIMLREKVTNTYYAATAVGDPTIYYPTSNYNPYLKNGYTWTSKGSVGVLEKLTVSGTRTSIATGLQICVNDSEYHRMEFTYNPSVIKCVRDSTTVNDTTDSDYTGNKYYMLGMGNYTTSYLGTRYIDWVAVRKYTATTPTLSHISSGYNSPNLRLAQLFESGTTPELLDKIFSSHNKILITKPFSTTSEILVSVSFASLSDIQVQRVFSQHNKILINKLFSSISDVQLSKAFASASDIQLGKGFASLSDIQLSKIFSSTSSIISSLLEKAFSSSSDIQLFKAFYSGSDIGVSKTFSSSSDIIELIQKAFSSLSDIQIQKHFESSSDIQVWKTYTSSSDILAILQKTFTSSNDIQVLREFTSNSDIKISKIFASSSDIIIVIESGEFDHPLTVVISQVSRTVTISQ